MSLNYANDRGLRTVKNSSGSNVDQYGILKLNGLDITPTNNASFFANKQVFNTTTPTADADFCIAQRAIPNGRYGPALFSGVSACKIQVSNESHQFAKAGTSLARLDSAESGPAKILWKESGTGEKNAVVLLAFGSSSTTPQLCSVDWQTQFGTISTNTTPTVHELRFGTMPSTDLSVFASGIFPLGVRLRRAGLYTIHCPVQVSETPAEVLRTFFNITDDASTVRTFSLYETHTIENRLVIAEPFDTNPWANGFKVGESRQESQHNMEVGALSTAWEWTTCYDRTVYIPQSLINQYGVLVLRNLIRVSIPSGTGVIRPYRNAIMPTSIVYWGDYAETFGTLGSWAAWTVTIAPTGQGPAIPGV